MSMSSSTTADTFSVFPVIERELADTGKVGVGTDVSIRHLHVYPNGALLPLSFADDFKDPGFVRVGN